MPQRPLWVYDICLDLRLVAMSGLSDSYVCAETALGATLNYLRIWVQLGAISLVDLDCHIFCLGSLREGSFNRAFLRSL